MPFFYIAAGGTIVLAVRAALRFLRRDHSDEFKDDLFFTDEDAGASVLCLHDGSRGRVERGHIARLPATGVLDPASLPLQHSFSLDPCADSAAAPITRSTLSEDNLRRVAGVQHNLRNNDADLASVSVSSSEARRRAVSVLKVRNWDDAGAASDWNPGRPDGAGSSGGGSGDEAPRLAPADSSNSADSNCVRSESLSGPAAQVVALAVGTEMVPDSTAQDQPPRLQTGNPNPELNMALRRAQSGTGATPVAGNPRADSGPQPGSGTADPSVTVASSMIGNCSRHSCTETSVPLRSCGTGTATLTSSSSPDTSQCADTNEQRSEAGSESRHDKQQKRAESSSSNGGSVGAQQVVSVAEVAAEVVAAGKRSQQASPAAAVAAAARPVVVGSAAILAAPRPSENLPAALWAPPAEIPEPLPLPPTILETRAPDPNALIAIQRQIEALRVQHIQRQAQALLTTPAASRAAPVPAATPMSTGAISGSPARAASSTGYASVDSTPATGDSGKRSSGIPSAPTSPVVTTLQRSLPDPVRLYGGSSSGMVCGGPMVATSASSTAGPPLARGSVGSRFAMASQPAVSGLPVGPSQGPPQLSDEFLRQLLRGQGVAGLGSQQPGMGAAGPRQHAAPGTQARGPQSPPVQTVPSQQQKQQWPDAAVQAARMGTLQRPSRPPAAQAQSQAQPAAGLAVAPGGGFAPAASASAPGQVGASMARGAAMPSQLAGTAGARPVVEATWQQPTPRPQAGLQPQVHPQARQVVAAAGMSQPVTEAQVALRPAVAGGPMCGHAHSLVVPQHTVGHPPLPSTPYFFAHGSIVAGHGATWQHQSLQAQQQQQQMAASSPQVWPATAQTAAGRMSPSKGTAGVVGTEITASRSQPAVQAAGHAHSHQPPALHHHSLPHVDHHHPEGHSNLHRYESSPPRPAAPPPSEQLLSSPPSFRHHLRATEGHCESESARRTADWINNSPLDDPASPTLRPHPPPHTSVSPGPSPTLPRSQSPGRALQPSPSSNRRQGSRLRHQDTMGSRQSVGGLSSHESQRTSGHGSRRRESSSKRKKMQELLLQEKLANQPPPSPLALYGARLLHQAGEKLMPAPRMPGGAAFFVPLKHEHRLELSSRPESAVSFTGDDASTSH